MLKHVGLIFEQASKLAIFALAGLVCLLALSGCSALLKLPEGNPLAALHLTQVNSHALNEEEAMGTVVESLVAAIDSGNAKDVVELYAPNQQERVDQAAVQAFLRECGKTKASHCDYGNYGASAHRDAGKVKKTITHFTILIDTDCGSYFVTMELCYRDDFDEGNIGIASMTIRDQKTEAYPNVAGLSLSDLPKADGEKPFLFDSSHKADAYEAVTISFESLCVLGNPSSASVDSSLIVSQGLAGGLPALQETYGQPTARSSYLPGSTYSWVYYPACDLGASQYLRFDVGGLQGEGVISKVYIYDRYGFVDKLYDVKGD